VSCVVDIRRLPPPTHPHVRNAGLDPQRRGRHSDASAQYRLKTGPGYERRRKARLKRAREADAAHLGLDDHVLQGDGRVIGAEHRLLLQVTTDDCEDLAQHRFVHTQVRSEASLQLQFHAAFGLERPFRVPRRHIHRDAGGCRVQMQCGGAQHRAARSAANRRRDCMVGERRRVHGGAELRGSHARWCSA